MGFARPPGERTVRPSAMHLRNSGVSSGGPGGVPFLPFAPAAAGEGGEGGGETNPYVVSPTMGAPSESAQKTRSWCLRPVTGWRRTSERLRVGEPPRKAQAVRLAWTWRGACVGVGPRPNDGVGEGGREEVAGPGSAETSPVGETTVKCVVGLRIASVAGRSGGRSEAGM